MRTLFIIISLLFTVSGWGQTYTAKTKVKCLVNYDNGKTGYIKEGKKVLLISEHLGKNSCKVSHKGENGTINTSALVMTPELDDFLFATERAERIKAVEEYRRIQEIKRKEEAEYNRKRRDMISSIILPRLKVGELSYKGIMKRTVYLAKDYQLNIMTPDEIHVGDTVCVFYYHNNLKTEVIGIFNDKSIGYTNASDLLINDEILDSLQCINFEDKVKYAEILCSQKKEEFEIKAKEEKINTCNELFKKGHFISIKHLHLSINSVGLLEPSISFTNNSSKDIKYITFNIYFKNGVDDIITNSIDRSQTNVSCQMTGYIKAYESDFTSWDTKFYNTTAKTFHISNISIIYRDGSKRTIGSQKCKELINEYFETRPSYLND